MGIVSKVTLGKFDKELIPLLHELNKAGLKTIASCCGHQKKPAYLAIDMTCLKMIRIEGKCLVLDWDWK